jgi:hypothetical protein
MKHLTKKLLTTTCTLALFGSFSSAFADVASDAERLLNWAELTYPHIFTSHKTTVSQGPWLYRNYIEAGILAGVNTDDNNVYVMGGPWGSAAPTVIGPLAAVMVSVDGTGDVSQICEAAALPEGMTITRNGNVITITTDGCIALPEAQNLCEFALPETPVATGISVLTTGVVTKMETKGILSTTPGVLDELLETGMDYKTCEINVPSETMASIKINTNVCYDMTAAVAPLSGLPGITIEPPVQMTLEASATTTQVNDCFATDADSVSNLVTGEFWIKENGGWTKISTTP